MKPADLQAAVQAATDAREELTRRGTSPGDALVMAGVALGVLLAGGTR